MEVNNIHLNKIARSGLEEVHSSTGKTAPIIKKIGNAAHSALRWLGRNADLIVAAAAIIATAVILPLAGPEILIITLPVLGIVAFKRLVSWMNSMQEKEIENFKNCKNLLEHQLSTLSQIESDVVEAKTNSELLEASRRLDKHMKDTLIAVKKEKKDYHDFSIKLDKKMFVIIKDEIETKVRDNKLTEGFSFYQEKVLYELESYRNHLSLDVEVFKKFI